MTTITLETVQARQAELAAMIAALQQPAAAPTTYTIPAATLQLAAGERYAGLILGDDGAPLHHLVLLPDRAEKLPWSDAVAWAQKTGGELPSRREQSLLYANLKDQFEAAWYWSAESYEEDGSYAWGQHFNDGSQGDDRKSYEGRAVAVRRFPA